MNNMEENSIEIEIGNRRSKLSTGPVFVKLTAEADKHDKENNLSSSEDHFVFIRDLESLLNENSWKYNETWYNVTAYFHARSFPRLAQI